MHAAYFKPGGIQYDLPLKAIHDIYIFTQQFHPRIDEIEDLMTSNRIWKQRLINIGTITAIDTQNLSFTGVLCRGSGIL